MNKLKHLLPRYILLTLYKSLVMPHLLYAIHLWGSKYKKLEKLQKRAIRIIKGTSYNAHTEPIFRELELLKLQDLCALHDLKFCYKFTNNILPVYFNSVFTRNSDNHSFPTRNANDFQITNIRNSFAKNNIRYRIPVAYNNCPNINIIIKEKIQTHSITGFSCYLKNNLLQNYFFACNIDICYICKRR